MSTKFFASHDENADLAAQVAQVAQAKGKFVRHNVTSYAGFAGVHRYVVFATTNPSNTNYNSPEAEQCWELPYSKHYLPAKRGEASVFRGMLDYLAQ